MSESDQLLRTRLVRLTVLPGWIVVGTVTLLFAVGLSLPVEYQFVPLVASVVLFGLPHGALDHLAPTQVRGVPATARSLLAVGMLYAVFGGLYGVSWFLAPVASFVLFILITWLHWGQGEIHALTAVLGLGHLTGTGQRLLAAVARGTLPMLVPLVFFPQQYQFVVETILGLFATSLGPAEVVFTDTGRLAVAALVAGLLGSSLLLGWLRSTSRREWFVDAGETLLLVLFFAFVPPILAVGLFFTCWHALRHIGRLLALNPSARRRLRAGQYGTSLLQFGRDAAPLTAASLLFLAVMYWFVPVAPGALSEWVGLYLVLIAALTLPHVFVVAYLDREQAVWTTRPVSLAEGGTGPY